MTRSVSSVSVSYTRHSLPRYKEFEWLRETLVTEHPYAVVPPLPGFALEGNHRAEGGGCGRSLVDIGKG